MQQAVEMKLAFEVRLTLFLGCLMIKMKMKTFWSGQEDVALEATAILFLHPLSS